ncbi:hypothetical protein GCK72_016826 [Caenorhabditis remanei]|uniref:7TM GPCR serpentine receptor class x (Srx) domain-containing protein n=1 Tax=Caenorhabditis remanei TaxID=31234 RepID=A0A6A5G720_CAERE|nr:hypothetical protein GCK72_016826 [Caenorhabditis remanei]KAF1750279.1 hypothetical protein GCK72_016826 [Caenorhabditis remanei]
MEPDQSWGIYIIPLSLLGVICNWLIVFAICYNKSSRHSFSLLTATQAAANGLFSVLYLLYVCPMIVFDLQVLRDNSHHVGYVLLICYDVNIHIHVLSTVNRFCAVFLPIMYNNVFKYARSCEAEFNYRLV